MNRNLLGSAAIFLLLSFSPVLAKTQSNITGTFESRSFEIVRT
ncbi:MAG TPA: hypothetical protein VJS91_04365 [Nitrososphaeraceae archaeon]|nr:hypothetical protein [Nitrososphaeraceae archaeon]